MSFVRSRAAGVLVVGNAGGLRGLRPAERPSRPIGARAALIAALVLLGATIGCGPLPLLIGLGTAVGVGAIGGKHGGSGGGGGTPAPVPQPGPLPPPSPVPQPSPTPTPTPAPSPSPTPSSSASPAPTVASISPGVGPIAGGTKVSITGTGFVSGTTVTIAGSALEQVVVQSSTTIAGVTSTTIAVGLADVVVSGPNGSGVLTRGFDYTLGLAPAGSAIALGGPASDLVSGDFDEDGKLDLAFATRGAFVGVLLGDGTGGFPKQVTTTASGHHLFGLAAADLDGDGHLDVVASDIDGSQVLVYHGDGTGKLTNTATIASAGLYPESVVLADFDENHSLDAAVAIFGSGNGDQPSVVQVLRGDGSGGFSSPGTSWAVMDGPQQLCVTDMNGDGHLDIFSTNAQTQGVSYLQGNGDGTFQSQVLIPTTYSTTLCAAAFGRTGNQQVFVGFSASSPVLISRDQTGSFQTTPIATSLVGHQNCVAVDLNRDGWPDVVAMASQGNQHSVFLNDRKGGFVEYLFTGPVCGPTPTAFGKLVAADFDGDGRVDIALASAVEDSLTIYLNR